MFKQIYNESDFRVVDIGWWNKKVIILVYLKIIWFNSLGFKYALV